MARIRFAVDVLGQAFGVDVVGRAPCNPDGAGWDAVASFACVSCAGNGIVRTEHLACPAHHLAHHGLAHHIILCDILGTDSKELFLQSVLLSH